MSITVRLEPQLVTAGEPTLLELVIKLPRPLKITGIRGRIRLIDNAGSGTIYADERWLASTGTLPRGEHRFEWPVSIPRDAPPTHTLHPVSVECRAHLTIVVNHWWTADIFRLYSLRLRRAPPREIERGPGSHALAMPGATPGAPQLEIVVPARVYAVGERIEGTFSVINFDSRTTREVDLLLHPVIARRTRFGTYFETGFATVQRTVLPPGTGAAPQPFQFTIPAWMPPDFDVPSHAVTWRLRVRVEGALEAAVPITIVDERCAALLGPVPTPARPSEAQLRQVLTELAQLDERDGWQLEDADLDVVDHAGRFVYSSARAAAVRKVGALTDRLVFAYRTDGRLVLVVTVDHPSFGLGLGVSPSTRLQDLVAMDINVGFPDWDRAHLVTARSTPQARPVLRPIVAALIGLGLGTLVRWTDDRMVFEQPVGNVRMQLPPVVMDLDRLHEALDRGRALIDVPPDVEIDLDAWRELARRMHGSVVLGDLSIRGVLHTIPVGIVLEWSASGVPTGVRVSAGDTASAGPRARELAIVLTHPATQVETAPDLRPAVESVRAWPRDIVDLTLTEGIATALLPLDTPARRIDVLRVRDLVERLCLLLRALDPPTGPYR